MKALNGVAGSSFSWQSRNEWNAPFSFMVQYYKPPLPSLHYLRASASHYIDLGKPLRYKGGISHERVKLRQFVFLLLCTYKVSWAPRNLSEQWNIVTSVALRQDRSLSYLDKVDANRCLLDLVLYQERTYCILGWMYASV